MSVGRTAVVMYEVGTRAWLPAVVLAAVGWGDSASSPRNIFTARGCRCGRSGLVQFCAPSGCQWAGEKGDPNDTFLRKVEKDIVIPKLVRDRSRQEKCIEEVAAFTKCGKDNGLLVWLKCRQENEVLKSCLAKWWYNEEFKEECKQLYLKDRAEFRRTGLTVKQRKAEEEKAKNAKHA